MKAEDDGMDRLDHRIAPPPSQSEGGASERGMPEVETFSRDSLLLDV